MNVALAASAVLCALDAKAQTLLLRFAGDRIPYPSPLTLSPLYAAVVLVNLVGCSYTCILLGMKVGKARKTYGIDYPTMYAEGKSKASREFNCVQRGHQQALETLPSFLLLSLVGGLRHPILTALAGVAWIVGRLRWADCYAKNGPEGRYGSFWSRFIWYSLIASMVCTISFACGLLKLF